jgi:hypothetical protein
MSRGTKNCVECGRLFTRHKGYGAAQWEAAKFCSSHCFGADHSRKTAERWPPLREQFETSFQRSEGCWEWQGTIDGYGYGVIDRARKRYRAHVLALEYDGRPVPKGMVACHHCDNPRCVRPSHLYVGTPKDNARDAIDRGRLRRGELHPQAKLSESQVREMRSLKGQLSSAEIGRRFGVSRPTAAKVIAGQLWRHVT